MKYGSLVIEKKEYVFLKCILNISAYAEDFETQKSLQRLSDALMDTHIVNEKEMPVDVIRINSKVTLSADNGWEKEIQLVAPANKNAKENKISILTPMGVSLIGCAQDDIVACDFPSGKQRLKVLSVTQHSAEKALNETI